MAEKKAETPEEKTLSQEVVGQMIVLATSGFGLVAALAWNTAIQGLFTSISVGAQNSLIYKFAYAVIITILIVLVTYYLSKVANHLQHKK